MLCKADSQPPRVAIQGNSLYWGARDGVPPLQSPAWEKSGHLAFRRYIILCLQDPEHIYNTAMVEALKESPTERDGDAGTI